MAGLKLVSVEHRSKFDHERNIRSIAFLYLQARPLTGMFVCTRALSTPRNVVMVLSASASEWLLLVLLSHSLCACMHVRCMLLLIVDVDAQFHVLVQAFVWSAHYVRHFGGHIPCCAQGFASVRSSPGDHGLAGAQACLVELRGGDGKQFKINLITEDSFDSINYQASFTAPAGARDANWRTRRVELKEFRPTFRGREVPGAPVLDPAKIRQVGLMISARQAGSFALDVRSISLV